MRITLRFLRGIIILPVAVAFVGCNCSTRPAVEAAPVTFFKVPVVGKRIVYIIENDSSMLDNFDIIRKEMIRSVNGMQADDSFTAIMLSNKVIPIFPTLCRATIESKKDFRDKMNVFRAQGHIFDTLDPFQLAFEKAFSLKPDVIFFLSEETFDPKLGGVIEKLNHSNAVPINTFVFFNEEPYLEGEFRDLAAANGGRFTFIYSKDFGR